MKDKLGTLLMAAVALAGCSGSSESASETQPPPGDEQVTGDPFMDAVNASHAAGTAEFTYRMAGMQNGQLQYDEMTECEGVTDFSANEREECLTSETGASLGNRSVGDLITSWVTVDGTTWEYVLPESRDAACPDCEWVEYEGSPTGDLTLFSPIQFITDMPPFLETASPGQEVTIDCAAQAAADGMDCPGEYLGPGYFEYDVDSQGRLTKITTTARGDTGTYATVIEIVFGDYGVPVDVEAPA